MKKIGMLVSAIALCASGAAMAQQGFYVGGGVGQSMTSFNRPLNFPLTPPATEL